MKTTASRASAVSQTRGFGDLLYDKAGARPSLDLDFAGTGSLRDKISGEYLVDHTRLSAGSNSSGTYIDSEGLIKKAPVNLFLHSQDFTQDWITGSSSSVTSNFAEAPDGTQTATRLVINGPVSGSYLRKNYYPFGSGGVTYTYSVWMKKNSSTNNENKVRLRIWNVGESLITVTDEWVRYSLTLTPSGNQYIGWDDNQLGRTDILIWGAQLEIGSTATEYIKTTSTANSAPRFTHERVETGNLLSKSENFADYTLHNLASIQEYATLSPSGNFDAVKITENTANSTHALQSPYWSFQTGKTYTFSCYVKAGTSTQVGLQIYGGTNLALATYNLTGDGTVAGLSTGVSANISKSDNGWYRCSVTGNPTTTTSNYGAVSVHTGNIGGFTGSNEFIYAWGLQLEEADSASTYVPSIDTFTSRQSNATYVDSAGLVKTAHRNLLKYSEDLSNSVWQKSSFTILSETTTAPDGSTTPWNNLTDFVYQDGLFNSAGTYTNSVYIKAETPCQVGLRIPGDTATNQVVNLTTEWQRFTITGTKGVGTQTRLLVDNRLNHTSNTVKIAIWGAQQVKGTEAGDYVKTEATSTGAARYSHDPETLTPTGLYLEPAATNNIHHSNHFHNPNNWAYNGGSVAIDNSVVAPTGETGVAVFTENTSLSAHNLNASSSTQRDILLSSGKNSLSLFVKPLSTRNIINIRINAIGTNSPSVDYKLDDQTVNYRAGTSNTTSQNVSWTANAYVEKYQNDWYRLVLNYDFGSANKQPNITINIMESDDITNIPQVVGNGQKTMAFFGLQNEASSYPSSYIDTTGSTVTRAADVYTSTPNLTETFEPRGLLIEQESINYITYSEDFTQGWSNFGNGATLTRTNDTNVTNPSGTTGATKVQITRTNHANQFRCIRHPAISRGVTDQSTVSFWIKAATTSDVGKSVSVWQHDSTFKLDVKITLTNDWVRHIFTASSTDANIIEPLNIGLVQSTANGGNTNNTEMSVGYYVWGAQFENGALGTSYIPTSGSTVTRSRDLASISGDNFGTYRTNHSPKSNQFWDWQTGTGNTFAYAHPNPIDGLHNAGFFNMRGYGDNRSKNSGITPNFTQGDISLYVKPVSSTCFVQLFTQRSEHGRANFDLINKTHGGDGTRSIEDVGNGWLRLKWSTPTHSTAATHFSINARATDLNTGRTGGSNSVYNRFYMYGAQVETGGFTNYIPRFLFTSRVSSATYVDNAGLIKKSPYNYILTSDLSQQVGAGNVTRTHNVATAPDGTQTASRLSPNTADNRHFLEKNGWTSNVGTGTWSIFVKADTGRYISLAKDGDDFAIFDSLTGTVTDQGTNNNFLYVIPYENGWYRIYINSNGTGYHKFSLAKFPTRAEHSSLSYGSPVFVGDPNQHSILYWGAQFETGSFPGDVVITTGTAKSEARYSHDPETLAPTGLYVEPYKILLIRRNIDFDHSDWLLTNATLTTNSNETNPDGTSGVKVLTATAGTKSGINSEPRVRSLLSDHNQDHRTFSIFVKKKTNRYVGFGAGGTSIHSMFIFDFDTETIDNISNLGSNTNEPAHANTRIFRDFIKYPNGWYRLFMTSFKSVGHGMQVFVPKTPAHNAPTVTSSFDYDGTESVYIWGAQAELGNMTSIIYGSDSYTTRTKDNYTSSATTAFDRDGGNKEAYWSPIANTMYGEMKLNRDTLYPRLCQMHGSGGESNTIFIDHTNGNLNGRMNNYEGMQYNLSQGSAGHNTLIKGANSYELDNAVVALNGTVSSSDNDVHLHNMSPYDATDTRLPINCTIGDLVGGGRATNAPIQRITHWKSRLSDASIINITKL